MQGNEERLGFFRTLTKKVDRESSQDAFVFALVQGADVKLRLEDKEGTRKDLDKAQSVLDSFDTVETEVHAAFYRVNARYYQATEDFAAYYKNALLYLACVEVSELTTREAQTRARDLSVAALASDSIYNFGELLLHPILDSLKDTEFAWLRQMLFAFNRGDLAEFKKLEGNLSRMPILENCKSFLYQKISIGTHRSRLPKSAPRPSDDIPDNCRGDACPGGSHRNSDHEGVEPGSTEGKHRSGFGGGEDQLGATKGVGQEADR